MQQIPVDSETPQAVRKYSTTARSAIKIALQILLLVGSALLIFLPSVRDQFTHLHEISSYLNSMGWAAPLVFIPAVALLVAIGVPRLLLCPIGGMAFGFYKGLLWAQLGTMLGFYATFLFVRWSGRDIILRKWPRLSRYAEVSRRKGIMTVLLIRQLPVTGFYINLLLGLMPLSHPDFLMGTMIGILPAAVPATLLGSGAVSFTSAESKVYTLLAIAAGIALWVLAGSLFRFYLKKRNSEDTQIPVAPAAESMPASE